MTDYQGVAPGSRPFKIFPGTNNSTTQNALIDQTVVFTANQSYTLIHTGFSRPGQTPADQLLVMQDAPPTVGPTDIAVRAMHLGAGLGNIDVYVSHSGGTTALPATATFTNLAYGNVTSYATLPALPSIRGVPLASIVGGYSLPSGTFAASGFAVGDQINASGFGVTANDGRSVITAITPSRTTGSTSLSATATGFARAAGSFVDDGFVAGTWITVSGFAATENNGRFLITAVTPTELTVGGTTGSATLAATTAGYTRTTGSFVTDGFFIGMPVSASGFTQSANNGASTVTNVTATTLTVAKAPATVAEDAAAGRTVSRAAANVVEAAAAGRMITSDAGITVTKSATIAPQAPAARQIIGELVFRATQTGTTTLVAEWTAPPGEPANPAANLQALGGSTMGGSAIMGLLVPRSVAGSSAPQTAPGNNPPTPGFLVPTWIFAIDKHPR
jgi:hypothetical protein